MEAFDKIMGNEMDHESIIFIVKDIVKSSKMTIELVPFIGHDLQILS